MEDRIVSRFEEDEDEFRSCCGDVEEMEESFEGDEFSVKMLFKGVSISERFSGIGVIMEGCDEVSVIRVQKKLEFFVDEEVADYLALMDGLAEAIRNNVKRVYAFTNSHTLFDHITNNEVLVNPLLMALKQRILEHVETLEDFVLKYADDINLEYPLHLAQVAIGIVHDSKDDPSVESCVICCEDKLTSMIVKLKCSHKFCSHCMKSYVDEKISFSEVPIRCPSLKCRYYISTTEHKSFLPVASYMLLEEALLEPNTLAANNFYCPFSDCAVLLDPSSNIDLTNNCIECPVCRRYICVKCGVHWHSSVSCDEFQEVPLEKMDACDDAFDCLAEDRKWICCQMCARMIELMHGCNHMTCWCGHEFCYSCGAEYINNQQTCECSLLAGEGEENDQLALIPSTPCDPAQHFEEWAWESFGSLSNMMDAYSDQERSQLALIQRFLAGGFSMSDHNTNPCDSPSPPSSCVDEDSSYIDDTIKDLNQLPWLERFVSVISDNYYHEYTES
ncbi:IBR domain-containing protein [Artemisia annua]|uniref:RBR-type E3 ubiquitin transferase n=1 Tax=Artemisia annua TaxID=35608 RepID=A0A2U1MWW5_ARTAN|nr:IBR domain-containing protein [Artemisia annua]